MSKFISSKTRDVDREYVSYVSGGTGAVPSTFLRARGIKSITRNTTGTFTVVTERGFSDLGHFSGSVEQAAVIAGAYSDFDITKAADLQLLKVGADGKSFTFAVFSRNSASNHGPAVVDPASGDVVRFAVDLKRSPGLA